MKGGLNVFYKKPSLVSFSNKELNTYMRAMASYCYSGHSPEDSYCYRGHSATGKSCDSGHYYG